MKLKNHCQYYGKRNTVKVLLRKWAEEIIHIKAHSGLYNTIC